MICLRVRTNEVFFPVFLMTQLWKLPIYANAAFVANYFLQAPSEGDAISFSL